MVDRGSLNPFPLKIPPPDPDDPESDFGPTAALAASDEKITINLAPIDVGLLDLHAGSGFSRSRSSTVRRAIHAELARHERYLTDLIERRHLRLASQAFDSDRLHDVIGRGRALNLRIVGRLLFTDDVDVELARRAINSARVVGVVRGPKDVLDAIPVRRGLE